MMSRLKIEAPTLLALLAIPALPSCDELLQPEPEKPAIRVVANPANYPSVDFPIQTSHPRCEEFDFLGFKLGDDFVTLHDKLNEPEVVQGDRLQGHLEGYQITARFSRDHSPGYCYEIAAEKVFQTPPDWKILRTKIIEKYGKPENEVNRNPAGFEPCLEWMGEASSLEMVYTTVDTATEGTGYRRQMKVSLEDPEIASKELRLQVDPKAIEAQRSKREAENVKF